MLVALAVNEFAASASISGRNSEYGSFQADAKVYPLRVSIASSEPSPAGIYPVRLPLASVASDDAEEVGLTSNVLLGAALQMPERLFDIAARLAAAEIAKADELQNDESGSAQQPPGRLVGSHTEVVQRSGSALSDVMNVRFDLVGQITESEGLAIRKPLFVNGTARGEVTLRIVRDSTIVASVADLRRAFGGTAIADIERVAGGEGYLDFDDLRSAGIAVRYDAVRDVVQMTASSEKS